MVLYNATRHFDRATKVAIGEENIFCNKQMLLNLVLIFYIFRNEPYHDAKDIQYFNC